MTPNEFKAWFEGFTENMKGPPSTKAWERIKARVAEITTPTPAYRPIQYQYTYNTQPLRPYLGGCGIGSGGTPLPGPTYLSYVALGRADAEQLAA